MPPAGRSPCVKVNQDVWMNENKVPFFVFSSTQFVLFTCLLSAVDRACFFFLNNATIGSIYLHIDDNTAKPEAAYG